jgi:hypothetical protein
MTTEDKSVLDRMIVGVSAETPKGEIAKALAISSAACAGLGAIAGACTGSRVSAERLLIGAGIGGASGLVLSLVGGVLKAQLDR